MNNSPENSQNISFYWENKFLEQVHIISDKQQLNIRKYLVNFRDFLFTEIIYKYSILHFNQFITY